VSKQYFVLYVRSVVAVCVQFIGWIDKSKWFIRYILYRLIIWYSRFNNSNPRFSVSHYAVQIPSRL